ncbi:MAG: hypothetical protein V3S69_01665 [Dehalococcoidales bacterium]
MAHTPTRVLLHFLASDPLDITKKCLAINHANIKEYEYMQPIKEGSGWIVFFYGDALEFKFPPGVGGKDV